MADPPKSSLKVGRETEDKIPAEISERLKQCQLDKYMTTDDGKPGLLRPGSKGDETITATTPRIGSRVESTISNSQIIPGRDMHSYQVNGNLIVTATENSEEQVSKNRGHCDKDDIAAGMLIPASPPCILERDTHHNQIVTKLLSSHNGRVAILGMGGIGKTTLACSVANDSQIVDAYPRRVFLSFEGCSTPDLAYTNLASAFQTPADRRSSHRQILSQVLAYLKQEKTLLIMDNFETFWEVSSNRRAAEELLAQFAALQKLAMIVTLRGIQRPGNIRWVKIEPLPTLTQDGSMELLSLITDEEYSGSEYVQKLLKAVSGIPLAVTLIGSLLRDESETPQSLWAQWTRESARAIRVANDVDSDDRLYKLDISLRLSVFGPRMSDNAKAGLAAISILPTGMNMDEEWLDRFQNLLPDTIRIRDCVRVLRDVALATLDSSTTPKRLRLLPPVRDFCLNNLCLDNKLSRTLIDIYNTDMDCHWDFGLTQNYSWVTTELSNITAIVNRAITLRYVTDGFGRAAYYYTEWRRLLCMPDMETVERAIDILSEHPEEEARCRQAFGSILSDMGRQKEAIDHLQLALSIHEKVGPKPAVGWDLYLLGSAHRRSNDYPNAERFLKEARDLLAEAGDDRRKGSVLRLLSWTYLSQDKLPEAQRAGEEALELSRTSGNWRGEANALGVLGDVYRKQGKYDLAVETLTAAINASQAIYDIHGEACGHDSLGALYLVTKKPHQAALHSRLALSLFEKTHDSKGADFTRARLTQIEASIIPQVEATS